MIEPLVRLPLVRAVDPAELHGHPWYHRIGLGPDLITPGVERYVPYQRAVLDALDGAGVGGRRVLDVGCRDGLVAFAAEQRGASEVVGLDNNPSSGAEALLVPASGSAVRFVEGNVLDVGPDALGGRFDVVVAAGLLYHLREPFGALRVVRDLLVDGGTLILETAVWLGPDGHADLWCPTGRDGPYDATSPTFFNRRGLRDTMASFGLVVDRWSELGEVIHHPRGRRARLLRRSRRVDRVTLLARRDDATRDLGMESYFWAGHRTRRWS
jgi:SAM-dependent methyltransferase